MGVRAKKASMELAKLTTNEKIKYFAQLLMH